MNFPHILLPVALIRDGQADWGYLRVVQSEERNVTRIDLKAMTTEAPAEWQPFASIAIINGRVAFHIHKLMEGTFNAAGTITPQSTADERTPQPVRNDADLRSTEVGEDPPGIVGRSSPHPL